MGLRDGMRGITVIIELIILRHLWRRAVLIVGEGVVIPEVHDHVVRARRRQKALAWSKVVELVCDALFI